MSLRAASLASPPRRARLGGALLGAVAAIVPMAWLWGFTVDDALITCRVAHHLAAGLGYRFNAGGPIVDAVTPLGFAPLLVPFAHGSVVGTLAAAKWLGAVCWAAGGSWLGAEVCTRASSKLYAVSLLGLLALTIPSAAWAVSGMETGLVTLLCTLALARGGYGTLAAALAAALRPELVPFCVVVRVGLTFAAAGRKGAAVRAGLWVLGAVAMVALIRLVLFGRPAPLASWAKPSDWAHGSSYALHGLVQCGVPILLLGPFSRERANARTLSLVVAVAAHFGALVLVGGDWMSLYRFWVPVLPACVLGAAELGRARPAWLSCSLVGLATASSFHLAWNLGSASRSVGGHRAALMRAATKPLAGAHSVAALDVGWVGATTAARVVDLAGVTDEEVAVLAGGHTSKRIHDGLLRSRHVDAFVLLASANGFARAVEARTAALDYFQDFELVARIPLGGTTQSYLVFRRRAVGAEPRTSSPPP